MTTFVFRDGQLVEKTKARPVEGFAYAPDIAAFTTHDGTKTVEITSRSHLRAYEQRHGVRQIGDQAKPVTPGMISRRDHRG